MSEIDEIVVLLRRGNQHAAFERLRVYLTHHPDDAIAWFWLSEATPQVSRKVEALRRFLALAPDHPRSAAVRGRLGYLESQLATQPPDPRPTVPITYDEDDRDDADTPSVATAPQAVVHPDTSPHPVDPPATDTSAPPVTPPPAVAPTSAATAPSIDAVPEGLTPIEPSRMPSAYRLSSLGTGIHKRPAPDVSEDDAAGRPAVPTFLQSLLDTAPMPEQRPDTVTLPESRPYPPPPQERRPSVAPTPTAPPVSVPLESSPPEPTEAVYQAPPTVAASPTHTETPAVPPITVIIQERMPVWAWVLAFLMVVQIGLQAYMIFTMQLMIAALTR